MIFCIWMLWTLRLDARSALELLGWSKALGLQIAEGRSCPYTGAKVVAYVLRTLEKACRSQFSLLFLLHGFRLYYTILYYTILYYTILYYTILYYTILYYTILYYTILYYTILYYTILYYTILYYTIQGSWSRGFNANLGSQATLSEQQTTTTPEARALVLNEWLFGEQLFIKDCLATQEG